MKTLIFTLYFQSGYRIEMWKDELYYIPKLYNNDVYNRWTDGMAFSNFGEAYQMCLEIATIIQWS